MNSIISHLLSFCMFDRTGMQRCIISHEEVSDILFSVIKNNSRVFDTDKELYQRTVSKNIIDNRNLKNVICT